MGGARLGNQGAAPRGHLNLPPRNGLRGPVRDALHRFDREHRLHDPERLSGVGVLDTHRDLDRPHPGGVVVLDVADGQEAAPRVLPPRLVGLDEVARRVGEGHVEPVAVGEEDFGEEGRGGNLLAQVRVGRWGGSEALAAVEPCLDLLDRRAHQTCRAVPIVRAARRVDDDPGRGPGLRFGDPLDEELVELARGVARLGADVDPRDVPGERLVAPREARLDDLQVIGQEEEEGPSGEGEGKGDADERVGHELPAQAARVPALAWVHGLGFLGGGQRHLEAACARTACDGGKDWRPRRDIGEACA